MPIELKKIWGPPGARRRAGRPGRYQTQPPPAATARRHRPTPIATSSHLTLSFQSEIVIVARGLTARSGQAHMPRAHAALSAPPVQGPALPNDSGIAEQWSPGQALPPHALTRGLRAATARPAPQQACQLLPPLGQLGIEPVQRDQQRVQAHHAGLRGRVGPSTAAAAAAATVRTHRHAAAARSQASPAQGHEQWHVLCHEAPPGRGAGPSCIQRPVRKREPSQPLAEALCLTCGGASALSRQGHLCCGRTPRWALAQGEAERQRCMKRRKRWQGGGQ